jgi:ser/thr/tyr protein kinase RAD53
MGNKAYLMLELVEGGDLLDYVIQRGFIPENETRFIGYQVAEALKYLHERNISHRDLKVIQASISNLLTS